MEKTINFTDEAVAIFKLLFNESFGLIILLFGYLTSHF
jgi:hypothetical protein